MSEILFKWLLALSTIALFIEKSYQRFPTSSHKLDSESSSQSAQDQTSGSITSPQPSTPNSSSDPYQHYLIENLLNNEVNFNAHNGNYHGINKSTTQKNRSINFPTQPQHLKLPKDRFELSDYLQESTNLPQSLTSPIDIFGSSEKKQNSKSQVRFSAASRLLQNETSQSTFSLNESQAKNDNFTSHGAAWKFTAPTIVTSNNIRASTNINSTNSDALGVKTTHTTNSNNSTQIEESKSNLANSIRFDTNANLTNSSSEISENSNSNVNPGYSQITWPLTNAADGRLANASVSAQMGSDDNQTSSSKVAQMVVNSLSNGSYLFNVYNYDPLVLNSAPQTLNPSVSFESKITTSNEIVSGGNQGIFDLPADVGAVSVQFDQSCLFPVFGIAVNSTLSVTVDNNSTPSSFVVTAQRLGIGGFNTGSLTQFSVNYFDMDRSLISKAAVYYQAIDFGDIMQPQRPKAIVFCPFFSNSSITSFPFTLKIVERTKNINTTLALFNEDGQLARDSTVVFVPYGGSNLILIPALPETCSVKFNMTSRISASAVFSYTDNGKDQKQVWNSGDVVIKIDLPANTPIQLLITNNDSNNSFMLRMDVEQTSGGKNSTAIIVGVVVPVVVLIIIAIAAFFFWRHRKQRRQFVPGPDEENPNAREGLLTETNANYVPIYGFNSVSKRDSSSSDSEKKNGLGPSLSDENPTSQKTMPESYDTNERQTLMQMNSEQAKIQIYTLKLDEFHENNQSGDIETILRQTKEKSEE